MEKISSAPTHIVVTGGESSGKSTLAQKLGDHFGAPVLPEYLRAFVELTGGIPKESDLPLIVSGHLSQVSASAPIKTPLLVLDTDLVSTMAYQQYYFDNCPTWMAELARREMAPLYILCDVHIPYEAEEGMRDSEEARLAIHDLISQTLDQWQANRVTVSGSVTDRVAKSIEAIDALLRTQKR